MRLTISFLLTVILYLTQCTSAKVIARRSVPESSGRGSALGALIQKRSHRCVDVYGETCSIVQYLEFNDRADFMCKDQLYQRVCCMFCQSHMNQANNGDLSPFVEHW